MSRRCAACGAAFAGHDEREHCSLACKDATAALHTLDVAVGRVQERCTPQAWLRLRSELLRLGNLRGWQRAHGTAAPARAPRTSTPWPAGTCRCCGADAPRTGTAGRPPATCGDDRCVALLEALRVAHSRLAGVAGRSTLAGWQRVRARLFLVANARAVNRGARQPLRYQPCAGSHTQAGAGHRAQVQCPRCDRLLVVCRGGRLPRHAPGICAQAMAGNRAGVTDQVVAPVGAAEQEPQW